MAQVITMPKLSDTMTVGTLVKWLKKEGDAVKFGDLLAEIETDKATMEFESFGDGIILKLYAQAGAQVAIGDPLLAVGAAGEAAPAAPAPATAPKSEEKKAPEPKQTPPPSTTAIPAAAQPEISISKPPVTPKAEPAAPAAPAAPARAAGERLRISPLAKKLAAAHGLDATLIKGSGPNGRIVRADVLAAEKAGTAKAGAKPASTSALPAGSSFNKGPIQEERTVPVSNMRGVIAKRLIESKTTAPHFYLEIEVDAEPLATFRAQLNTGLEKAGIKLSVNDLILKASAEALRKVPEVNGAWEGTQIRYFGTAHVSFAVALPDGLITPVVRDAHEKSVFQISAEAKALGKLAKDKKLKPDQYTGGTFCVSNLGMMGIPKFYPIINTPNAAILGVGASVTKPVVKNGQIVVGSTLTLTLSCDHRVVDGAVGAQFLNALKGLLESPALLLV
ncbi:MAG: pyruvate dehydrogenase complex dihydrolipoamide acetyltransferase [Verrucomicrobia bacterium]|nr:MAG: pyruvate dehydrogenase complex dihydrolipoamide acetyltransferase [Verrucomicrobiota bacterium]